MRISGILTYYIGRQYVLAFIAVSAAIGGLVLLFDMVELLRRAAGRPDVGFGLVMRMGVFKLPQMLQSLLPFVILISGMIVFWRLTRSNELVVTRAAGVSVWQFLLPIIGGAFIIGIVNVLAFNPVAAKLYTRYERLQDQLLARSPTSPLAFSQGGGLWLREGQGRRQTVIHAEHARQEGMRVSMRNVMVIDMVDERFARRVDATLGAIENSEMRLENVWVMEPGKPSVFHEAARLPTSLTIGKIQDNFASPETMSFWELPGFIAFTEASGFSANKHRVHFQALLSTPILLCSMVLIAAIFGLRPNLRAGGVLLRVGASVLTGFVLYFFTKVVLMLGMSNTLPPVLAAWSPATVTMLIGASSLFHLEDG
jgi:lipopolysaccharide export system permease protein